MFCHAKDTSIIGVKKLQVKINGKVNQMKKSEFLTALEDILQREEPCLETDNLDDYDEWDSLSQMAVMALFRREKCEKLPPFFL